MRLIDAEALLERAVSHGWSTPLWVSNITIEDAPTIDAVEVVRCKDCKYWMQSDEMCLLRTSRLLAHETRKVLKPDGFCSEGERREDG